MKKHLSQIAFYCGLLVLSAGMFASSASAAIVVSANFSGAAYTNLGRQFTVTLNATTKGNNSKKTSCGKSYVSIGSANMRIVDAKIGDIPNSTVEKQSDGTYIVQTPSKEDCIPDGDHVVATFTAETVITGNSSIYSTNGKVVLAGISTSLVARNVMVYPDVCPAGKTGIPPDCTVMAGLTDVCDNLGGVQTGIPDGMKKDDKGDCVVVSDGADTPESDISYQFVSLSSEKPDETGSIVNPAAIPSVDSVMLKWEMKNGLKDIKIEYVKDKESPVVVDGKPSIEGALAYYTIGNLSAFQDYTITISGTNEKGEVAKYSGIVKTRGYLTEITLKQNGEVRSGVKVTIAGVEKTSDSYGLVKFELPDGSVDVRAQLGEQIENHKIDVKKQAADETTGVRDTQEFVIELTPPAGFPWWIIAAATGGVLLLGLAIAFIVRHHNRRHMSYSPEYQNVGVPSPTPEVTLSQIPVPQPTQDQLPPSNNP